MRIPRIYHPNKLNTQQEISLTDDAANHIARVLRLDLDHPVILFNGQGGEFEGKISYLDKKTVRIYIERFIDKNIESPIHIHLAQVISRGEKMDFTIQKAVELGIYSITPLISERCGVKLSQDRWDKKLEHWQKVVISACEQSGRNFIPSINAVQELNHWLPTAKEETKLILHPEKILSDSSSKKEETDTSLFSKEKLGEILILIGPEGGFSENEIALAKQYQFQAMQLGPRVLRTETAGLAAIAVIQTLAGDFIL